MSREAFTSRPLPPSLPRFDRRLLRAVACLVPAPEREDWSRTWQAELWHLHHRSRTRPTHFRRLHALSVMADLSIGLTLDALWLRTDLWRRTYSGSAGLCLASLSGLCLLSVLIALLFTDGGHALSPHLRGQIARSLLAAVLVVFVAFATATRRPSDRDSASQRVYWIRRQAFFTAKMAQVLLLGFLLSLLVFTFSLDVCRPIHVPARNVADVFQLFSFVFFALVGLRWVFRDQEQRCKQCLHLLNTPARVGRPSHNLLEWNGTELNCKEGHGLLSVPEIETSWCQSSQWVNLSPNWDKAASI